MEARQSYVVLLGIFVLLFSDVSSQYAQECHSLDNVIETLIRNMATFSRGMKSSSCIKTTDCTSMICSLNFMGRQMEMSIILSPCSAPPQMTFGLRDGSGNVHLKENITHQTTFPLPNLGLMIKSSIRVDFEPVPTGVRFGLYWITTTMGIPVATPIVPDLVIHTPPCDNLTPFPPVFQVLAAQLRNTGNGEQCQAMEDMLTHSNIPSSFVCQKQPDCLGFQCNGTVQGIDLEVSLHMDPCSTPVSFYITINSVSQAFTWSHNYSHTETIPISQGIAGIPLSFSVKVTMVPDDSGTFITTSIILQGCTTSIIKICPINEKLLDNQRVPIPPCSSVPPSSPSPTLPSSVIASTPTSNPECNAWTDIIHQLITVNELGDMHCNITANCTGFICNVNEYMGSNYVTHVDLQHCTTPVVLWISIKSEGSMDWQRSLQHGDTIVIPGTGERMKLVVKLAKRDDNHVELGIDIISTVAGFIYNETLIEDQLIPVVSCNGTNHTTVAMPTTGTDHSTVAMPTTGTDHTTVAMPTTKTLSGHTDGSAGPTMNVYGWTTAAKDGKNKPNKVPVLNGDDSNNIGIILGVLLAGMLVLCVVAGLLYFNRRRRIIRSDETALVEDNFAV